MADPSVDARAADAPPSLFNRFAGVLFSPRETFMSVVRHPRWLGMLLTVMLVSSVSAGALFSTEAGQQAWIDQMVRSNEAWGQQVDDRQYDTWEKIAGYMGYIAAAIPLITVPLFSLFIAGLAFAIFNAAMGGEATFKQVLAVVVHSGAVSVVQQLFAAPLNYARGSITSPTNLSVLLPMVDETSFIGRLVGTIDVFLIWWVFTLAIGLAVLYRRRTAPIAIALFAVYGLIALAIAGFQSMVGGK